MLISNFEIISKGELKMAFYVGKEQLLACTVGQIEDHSLCSLGVGYEDIEEFKKILRSSIPINMAIYIDDFDGKEYLNDSWRRHYYVFQNRYRLQLDGIFEENEKVIVVGMQIAMLRNSFNIALKEKGLSLNDNDDPIGMAINSFKDYYDEKYQLKNPSNESYQLKKVK